MISVSGEEPEQIDIAVLELLSVLRLQATMPGIIEPDQLPVHLIYRAERREKHGDFGACRLLCGWADALRDGEVEGE